MSIILSSDNVCSPKTYFGRFEKISLVSITTENEAPSMGSNRCYRRIDRSTLVQPLPGQSSPCYGLALSIKKQVPSLADTLPP